MEIMKLTKEYTYDEIREDIGEQVDHALKMLSAALESSNNLSNCFQLRVVNLLNIKDNIHALRRELYAVDQSMEQISSVIDKLYQHASEAQQGAPADDLQAPSQEAEDEQTR